MKLQDIIGLQAGGPGSGPQGGGRNFGYRNQAGVWQRPGSGLTEGLKKAAVNLPGKGVEDALKEKGFKPTGGSAGRPQYEHPEHGRVHVEKTAGGSIVHQTKQGRSWGVGKRIPASEAVDHVKGLGGVKASDLKEQDTVTKNGVEMKKPDFVEEHKHLVRVLRKGSKQARLKEAKDQAGELSKMGIKAGEWGHGGGVSNTPDYTEVAVGIQPVPTSHPPSLKNPTKIVAPMAQDGWKKGDSKASRKQAMKDLIEVHKRLQRQSGHPTVSQGALYPLHPSIADWQ